MDIFFLTGFIAAKQEQYNDTITDWCDTDDNWGRGKAAFHKPRLQGLLCHRNSRVCSSVQTLRYGKYCFAVFQVFQPVVERLRFFDFIFHGYIVVHGLQIVKADCISGDTKPITSS